MATFQHVAPGVHKLALLFVNVYALGEPGGEWVLVDSGIPGSANKIEAAARELWADKKPQAIVLTHGHVDHAGSAQELAETWDVPILAARDELPFLSGRSDYPPKDPTVGGYMGAFSRLLPAKGFDFGTRVAELTELPAALHEWDIIPTPGHSPGHVSLWRASDKTLIAGDALATCDLQSWVKAPLWVREIARPPLPFTPDWEAARASVEKLAALQPFTIGAGHGTPMTGENVSGDLHELAQSFPVPPPEGGRYAFEAPQYENGALVEVPPPLPDRRAQLAKMVGAGVLLFALLNLWRRRA